MGNSLARTSCPHLATRQSWMWPAAWRKLPKTMTLRRWWSSHQRAPSRTFWDTVRTKLSPVTLTVILTLTPLMLGLALPSMTTVSNLFPVMTMNLVTATRWWSYGFQGVGDPWTTSNRESKRKRDALNCWGVFAPTHPSIHWESPDLQTVSILDPLKKRRGSGSPTLSCIIKCTVPSQKKTLKNV